jgi:hypothetical protein
MIDDKETSRANKGKPPLERPRNYNDALKSKKGFSSNNSTRYLRVGNVPVDTKPEHLLNFLNEAMRQANLCYCFETPIRNCCCLINKTNEQTVLAYLGFSNATVAQEALALSGVSYSGHHLEIGRPKRNHPHVRKDDDKVS